jgi:gliding motility-associated-like protein
VAGDLQVALATTTPCEGSPFTITANTNITGTAFQWSFNGADITGATQDTLQASDAGTYEVAVSLPGCTVTTGQDIILAPVTSGELNDKYLICNNVANPDPNTRQVVLDPGDQFNAYQWFKEQIAIGVSTETYTATETGDYSVDLINLYGCPSSDKTIVVEECNPRVVAPNAFRPDSNITANSNFSVFTYFVDDDGFQIFIFNRWGQLVFQSNSRDFKWNGGMNNNPGHPLPPGTYSYVVKYKSIYTPEAGLQETRGGVLLLR